MLLPDKKSINQNINLEQWSDKGLLVEMKREDLLHPDISGNKYRKLKYNLKEALSQNHSTILTFGGAYSNHIAATAAAAKLAGLRSIGVIRGEELKEKLDRVLQENPTLRFAHDQGMSFEFISREEYRKKNVDNFRLKYGDFTVLPEGGTNELAVKGCEEILSNKDSDFDCVTVCCGTGGTISGIIRSSRPSQRIIGFPAMKGGSFLEGEIAQFTEKSNWELNCDWHFGGYAKVTENLITFINDFKDQTGIALDPVYTGKMMFGLDQMIRNNEFAPGTKILCIHTGGQQAIEGMNKKLKEKGQNLIR